METLPKEKDIEIYLVPPPEKDISYIRRMVLREGMGLREGLNLPGMLERILYFDEQGGRGFWSRPFHRGLISENTFDKIEYIKRRLMDITGKTEPGLQSNLGAHLEDILEASREYEELRECAPTGFLYGKSICRETPKIFTPFTPGEEAYLDIEWRDAAPAAPAINIAKTLIKELIKRKSTNMKLVKERGLVVSFRVDDQYEEIIRLPLYIAWALYSGFKIMVNVDPAVNSQEQTGIVRAVYGAKSYNLEMKFSPSETRRGVTEKLEIEIKD